MDIKKTLSGAIPWAVGSADEPCVAEVARTEDAPPLVSVPVLIFSRVCSAPSDGERTISSMLCRILGILASQQFGKVSDQAGKGRGRGRGRGSGSGRGRNVLFVMLHFKTNFNAPV